MSEIHEDLSRTELVEARIGSERSFGLVFSVLFAVIALYPLMHAGTARFWSLVLAIVLFALSYVCPVIFCIPNRIWFRFGLLLAAIVGPVAIAVVYAIAIVPVGLLMRLSGKDPLRLKFEPEAKSYWLVREPAGPDPKDLPNQF